jgi:hypothetical protein
MRILKLRKEEERPRKLQAIKRKVEKIYRFCCALSKVKVISKIKKIKKCVCKSDLLKALK